MATPTVETAIWLALRGRIETIPGAMPMAWPNEAFTPPRDANGVSVPYLRIDMIPNTTQRVFIGSTDPHRYRGILQIGVMARLNQNLAVGMEIAGDVADHFPADLRLTAHDVTVRVTSHPSLGPAQPQATHLMIPVSIEFESYH